MSIEHDRLKSDGQNWKRWGPYLSERAWGTVREDYSATGDAWSYFTHDHARSRVYRWNEDGLAGVSDDQQFLCFALALWNGRDPILKERLFGLAGPEGNHGEDVKEYYFYLDSTPTHSYMKMLYKYPQTEFPYRWLIEENHRRSRQEPEFELIDTGIFDENLYFDVFVEYAKASPDDILIRISATNRGPGAATLWLLPTLWFRNTWSWGRDDRRPEVTSSEIMVHRGVFTHVITARHHALGEYQLFCENTDQLLFTDNETNIQRLFGATNTRPYVKDAFHECIVHGNVAAVNPEHRGTKSAALYKRGIPTGETVTTRLRLQRSIGDSRLESQLPITNYQSPIASLHSPFADFDEIFTQRLQEADEFYDELQSWGIQDEQLRMEKEMREAHFSILNSQFSIPDLKCIQRQAFAGMLWSKQFYHYDVMYWLDGDPAQPAPPPQRKRGRNRDWTHLNNAEVISMPDKWEYPWYAAWDLAFHCIALALVDAEFAKNQLDLLTREWYQHPNGEVPAYEWNFGDVNPPVLGWAAWRVFQIDRKQRGDCGDLQFLERVYHKLLLSFTWWVNRKDSEGNNVFQGGFLGLDNIGVFDRSAPLPTGGHIEQSDGTSWMGMYCLNLMKIALELAQHNPVYEDIATKFFEHFLYIAGAMNNISGDGVPLWNDDDEFFYDVLHLPGDVNVPLTIRSMVGLIPLFAVETIEPDVLDKLRGFKERLEWFLGYRQDLAKLISRWQEPGLGARRLVALTRGHRFKRLLRRALDPNEFLSDYGVRALSRIHEAQPYMLHLDGANWEVRYEPGESQTGVFGGNSNWRGPVWFPVNFLLIESLQKFHHYFGDDFKVECPTGSGTYMTIDQIADELSWRLIRIFMKDANGRRPVFGNTRIADDPHWRDYIPFYEYLHGDTGAGLGASHQTGWTGLVAKLIQQQMTK
jgi:hypothetical protein